MFVATTDRYRVMDVEWVKKALSNAEANMTLRVASHDFSPPCNNQNKVMSHHEL